MICFVILHYIATDETIKCVDSIINNVIGDKKIIIVDNFSPNNSYVDLKKNYQNIKSIDVIKTNSNLGFANGNNFGYQYAISKYNPEFIVVMNNDMEILQNNFIDLIYENYKNYNFCIMGPDIYSTKKEYHQNPQVRKLMNYKQLKNSYIKLKIKNIFNFIIPIKWKIKEIMHKNYDNYDNYKNRKFINDVVINPMLHGSCYIFSKSFINKHPNSCFYQKTFMYLEAEILYYLALKNKEKMIYCPNLKVFHHEDVSTDYTFKKQYKKSIFSIKCLLSSTKAFIKLMEEYGDNYEKK